jgi:hypothetical protein
VFVLWLALFGGGILIDTEPYRTAISAKGASQLRAEGRPPDAANPQADAPSSTPDASGTATGAQPRLIRSWLIVLTCFLPLNLAWLCVLASTLGAIGNVANLSDDRDEQRSPDTATRSCRLS